MRIALLITAVLMSAPAHAERKKQQKIDDSTPAMDDLQLEGTIGKLRDEEIKAPFHARWEEIKHCYQTAQELHWFISGKLSVKVRVGDQGKPKLTYIQTSDVGNYDAERCLLNVVSTLSFAKPHGGSEAEFIFPIEFRAKNALETWQPDHAKVQKRLRPLRQAVAACMNKGAPDQVSLTMYIMPGGKISSAGVSADAPIEQGFGSCVVASGLKWRASDPDKSIAKITIPFSKQGFKDGQ